ncbi:hypothetical protein BGAL_0360g00120 [Botrytis galanthina]|uniref:Uncharacterized protein n=1 Tax=Botrytis galanthina TaxID=278940 RepID=A0A4S8R0X7_9HELO|nr:hypothetical protein BGAL_0360g00120 [Botrytis galanthina]
MNHHHEKSSAVAISILTDSEREEKLDLPDFVQMNKYKLTLWAIIDEDVFDYVEAHSIEAQSELKGFIKET